MSGDVTPPNSVANLRCRICDRLRAISQAEFLEFIQSGWPRCCGEIMSLTMVVTTPSKPAENAGHTPGLNPTRTGISNGLAASTALVAVCAHFYVTLP